ncbi:MAG TPA: hypothetical protein VES40_20095, partial [Ilumatobacteraceae bacterium]|nr:hypothetical protein [Ilumatobacteraceae bacterium]
MRTRRSRMCRSGHQKKATLGAAVVGSSCGGSSTADETSEQAPNPTTGAVKTGSATPSSYSTTVFAAPFDIAVPDWLEPRPSEEHPNFVTWNERAAGRAVRFLIPVDVFAPGTADAGPVPDDFVGYLMAQRDHGAKFSDEATTTVDGRPATIVTATIDQGLDGSLGCPEANMSASDCFGLQPEFVLRIAVIETGAAPLLVWLRDDVYPAPDLAADRDAFDQVLANVHFSDRTPQAPAASSASAIDGTYQWTITEADALARGTASDRT